MRPIFLRPPWRRLSVTALFLLALLSCGRKQEPQPSPLSADEKYLVDAYLSVRRTGAMHTYQRDLADRLLDSLAAEIDTVRVARTIAALNATPERWSFIFRTIEDRLAKRDSTATSETTGD